MFTVIHPHPPQDNPKVTLQGIAWQTYQSLVQDLESQPAKRLTYANGMLKIFMPLPPHETYKRLLGRLVEIVTEELDLEIRSLSASTWSRKDLLKGVEADECYYVQTKRLCTKSAEVSQRAESPS